MKYLVFSYEDYDACGGLRDFSGYFENLEDAIEWVKTDSQKGNGGRVCQNYDIAKLKMDKIKVVKQYHKNYEEDIVEEDVSDCFKKRL